jgi:hypothetical protein
MAGIDLRAEGGIHRMEGRFHDLHRTPILFFLPRSTYRCRPGFSKMAINEPWTLTFAGCTTCS